MSFLNLGGKRFLVVGLSNRRSVAYAIGKLLREEGAEVLYSVRNEERKAAVVKLVDAPEQVFTCDLERADEVRSLASTIGSSGRKLDGLVHSVAYANYSAGFRPFHETERADFLQAVQVSAFSLVELAHAFKSQFSAAASVVSIGISSPVAAANYGYMSPVKSTLEGCSRFLAKSFSVDSEVRFNIVNAGPLRTKSSAGIPGYLENYLYAEKLTMRKRALTTDEVANTAVFLLSERSSGINAQGIVVNAGMDLNYFDEEVVRLVNKPQS